MQDTIEGLTGTAHQHSRTRARQRAIKLSHAADKLPLSSSHKLASGHTGPLIFFVSLNFCKNFFASHIIIIIVIIIITGLDK